MTGEATGSDVPGDAALPADAFARWCAVADVVRATTKRLEKGAALAAYFPTLDDAALATAARFLSGIVFARHDMRTTSVGGAAVSEALAEVLGVAREALRERAIAVGELGDAARALLEERGGGARGSGRTLAEVAAAFDAIAATRGAIAKRGRVAALLAGLGAAELQYAVKLLLGGGELRIGLKEAQVEEALARAYGRPLALVRHANLLRGDVGEVAVLARHDRLAEARLALFHPIGFMLAQPLETAEEIAATLDPPFALEDKYDGIRAQAHLGRASDGRVRVALYSRTLDEITHAYPEVVEALTAMATAMAALPTPTPATTAAATAPRLASSAFTEPPAGRGTVGSVPAHTPDDDTPPVRTPPADGPSAAGPDDPRLASTSDAPPEGVTDSATAVDPGLVLDGELLAVDPTDLGRALPFNALQRRLGRKQVDDALRAEVPVQFVAYDVLAWRGALVLDEPYAERRARLAGLPWLGAGARLAPHRLATTAGDVEAAFAAARAAGNEGLIAKALASPYTPGRRGKHWIKLKKALATLDVVIVGAEWGHGRRARVLSDYTFAVRASADDPTLLTVGKAYNGLTDVEIAALTERLRPLVVQRFGRYHQVRPEVVLEVTFDVVQRSTRHKAGYALRFPRIVRVRDDKPVGEVDTLETVKRIGEGEGARAGGARAGGAEPGGAFSDTADG